MSSGKIFGDLANLCQSLQCHMASLTNRRRLTYSLLLGGLAGLSFQPVNFVFLLWLVFPLLLAMAPKGRGLKSDLAMGWCFAFGFFLVGLYWVGISATVDLETFWWFVPIASAGLPALLALFTMPAIALATRLSCGPFSKILFFILFWLIQEWLRSWVLTGFPWNLIGYSVSFSLSLMQLSSVGGVWILSATILISASLPYMVLAKPDAKSLRYLMTSATILLLTFTYGYVRLLPEANEPGNVPGVNLRLVQANISQSLKWDANAAQENLFSHMDLSTNKPLADDGTKNIIIWSESSVPYLIDEDAGLLAWFADKLPVNSTLITGANRREKHASGASAFYNSLFVINDQGDITNGYDKKHLVPFGEYVPLSGLLPVQKLTAGMIDFHSGEQPGYMQIGSLPALAPMICYEIIFPGRVVETDRPRPDWILNITNDAWFGKSSGPFQHFAMARMRAIEEGLPLIRVSNPGISAIIDGKGRITAATHHDKAIAIDGSLPRPLTGLTLFARLGNSILLYLLIALAILALQVSSRERRQAMEQIVDQ